MALRLASVLVPGLLVTLAMSSGCAKQSLLDGANGGDSPLNGGFCSGVAFDANVVAKTVGTAATLGYRVEAPAQDVSCDESTTVNGSTTSSSLRGYSKLYVYPKLRVSGDATIDQQRVLKIPLEVEQIPDDRKAALAAAFGAKGSSEALAAAITVQPAEIDRAQVAGLTLRQAHLVTPDSSHPEKVVLEVSLGTSTVDPASATKRLVVYSTDAFFSRGYSTDRQTALAWNLTASFSDEAAVDVLGLAQQDWKLAQAAPDTEHDADLDAALADATDWVGASSVPAAQVAAKLSDELTYAKQSWSPSPGSVDATDDEAMYTRLSFIHLATPSDPAEAYYDRIGKLESVAGLGLNAAMNEAMRLVDSHPYTADQENVVFATAGSMKDAGLSPSDVWDGAQNLARAAGFDSARISSVIDEAKWLASADGPDYMADSAVSKAEDYVLTQKLSSDQLELLKQVYSWAYGSDGLDYGNINALSKAEDYVITRKLSGDLFDRVRRLYAWLASPDGPDLSTSHALEKAEGYVFTQHLSADQLVVLEGAAKWLASYDGPSLSSASALAKAETYVFTKAMDSAKLKQLQDTFADDLTTMSSAQALAAAEQAVLK